MNSLYTGLICEKLAVAAWQVENCIELIEEGATIPFISRYRKERTGALDETQVAEVRHHYLLFQELDKRKHSILKSIEQQERLTDELRAAIENEVDAQALEDLYLPYRPKRRTRASVAREKGLEPLADALFNLKVDNPEGYAARYLTDSVSTVEDALAGARDIIAERVSEMSEVRSALRDLYSKWGVVTSKVARGKEDDEQADKYRSLFNVRERLDKMASHRLLALLRASSEGFINVKVEVKPEFAMERIERKLFAGRRGAPASRKAVLEAAADGYTRLLHPSIENDVLGTAKEKADIESIKVFGENLRQLLLAPPVGQKRTLAIDPGFRTGCKVVCLDSQGNLLCNDTIYPHPPINEKFASMRKISAMVEKYDIEIIAIGSGTAGRETEAFIRKIALPEEIGIYSVSEDGASVYSASEIAREEFPDYDLTVRGAVSIGRRLMDPLSELVKIDPKSIGVGQYQHDVDQTLLKEMLDNTVESCVNMVGVNLNTASRHLLRYVSGIGPVLAGNIVEYRRENGFFTSRQDLLKVKRLGGKVFEQCAGFLRIPDSSNPLDNSAVHPESYAVVEKMAEDCGATVEELISKPELRKGLDLKKYVTPERGLPTLEDIMNELAKPGRDPRGEADAFSFSEEISTIEDLQSGMVLPGIVTNITDFGAFVDIGIKQQGLIHVSRLGKGRGVRAADVLKVRQCVEVTVLEVDLGRKRISLALN